MKKIEKHGEINLELVVESLGEGKQMVKINKIQKREDNRQKIEEHAEQTTMGRE